MIWITYVDEKGKQQKHDVPGYLARSQGDYIDIDTQGEQLRMNSMGVWFKPKGRFGTKLLIPWHRIHQVEIQEPPTKL